MELWKKHEEWVCPKCGSDEPVDCNGIEYHSDLMINKMWCSKCNHSWREYNKL